MKSWRAIAVGSCLVAFLALGLALPDRPGLHFDEANRVAGLFETGRSAQWLRAVFSGDLRAVYLAIRLPSLLIGLAALFLLYRLARACLSEGQALLVLALGALDPALIFHAKTDLRGTAPASLLVVVILLLLAKARGRGVRYVLAASFVAGLAVWNRPDALLFVMAVIAGFWIAWRPLPPFGPRETIGALVLFAPGAALAWLAPWQGRASEAFFDFGASMTLGGKVHLIEKTLSGVYPFFHYFHGTVGARYTVLPHALGLIAVTALIVRVRTRRPLFSQPFCPAVGYACGLYLAALAVLPAAITNDRIVVVAGPLIMVLVGLSGAVFDRLLDRPALRKTAWVLWGTPLLVIGLVAGVVYNQKLAQRQGQGYWTRAVDPATVFCMQERRPCVALDWGIAQPIRVLSNGTVVVKEICPQPGQPGAYEAARANLNDLIGRGQAIFLMRPAVQGAFRSSREIFQDLVLEAGRCATVIRVFENRAGRPEIFAMTLSDGDSDAADQAPGR